VQEQAHAITQAQFDGVPEGTTRDALVAELGSPTDEAGRLHRGWVRAGEFARICTGTQPEMVPFFASQTDDDATDEPYFERIVTAAVPGAPYTCA
jgi:hypothetical protein